MSYKRKNNDNTIVLRQYDLDDIITRLNKYIDITDEPLIQEFALNYKIPRQYIYELSDRAGDKGDKRLSDAIARVHDKRELYILRGAATRAYDPNFAQFILKQPAFGYKDKTETDINLTQAVQFTGEDKLED